MLLELPVQNNNNILKCIISTSCFQPGVRQNCHLDHMLCCQGEASRRPCGCPPARPSQAGLVSGPHLSNLGLGITMKVCVYIVFLLARFPSGYNLMPLPLKMGGGCNIALLCQRGGRKSQNKIQESWLLGSLSPLGADVFAPWRSFPFPGKCLVLSIVRLLGRSCNKQCR